MADADGQKGKVQHTIRNLSGPGVFLCSFSLRFLRRQHRVGCHRLPLVTVSYQLVTEDGFGLPRDVMNEKGTRFGGRQSGGGCDEPLPRATGSEYEWSDVLRCTQMYSDVVGGKACAVEHPLPAITRNYPR
jgi:hypothetical protein